MKHWKDIAFGLFVSLTLAACYGEEDSFATPDIYIRGEKRSVSICGRSENE